MYADAYGLYNADRTYTFSEDELLGFAKELYKDTLGQIKMEAYASHKTLKEVLDDNYYGLI